MACLRPARCINLNSELMHIESLRTYCLQKPGVTESFPFDETTLVFKVQGKMFLLTDTEDAFRMNIKATPEDVLQRREQYSAVEAGYHMNKKHWVTVRIDGRLPDSLLYEWIDESYRLVVNGLPKRLRTALGGK